MYAKSKLVYTLQEMNEQRDIQDEDPMVVPLSCLNVMLPKEKMLFNITSLSAAIKASFCFGRSSGMFLRRCLAISMMAVLVGMFVYIDMASAVKSCAVVGYCVEHKSWRRSKLLQKNEICCLASDCSLRSVQIPSGCNRLPGHDTIERLLRCVTF